MATKTLSLQPRLNEKTYGLADARVYVFDVEGGANKHDIARAVEAQFEVKVASVNTMNVRGKSKRTVSLSGKRYTNDYGSRSNVKKAYVTLAKGHGLPFFEAIEEEIAKEQATQEKVDKAAAKQAVKEEKAVKKASKADTKPKPEAKPKESAKPAEKPAAKAKPVSKPVAETKPAKTEKPDKPTAPAEEEPKKKPFLAAWRGFRLRKKNKEGK